MVSNNNTAATFWESLNDRQKQFCMENTEVLNNALGQLTQGLSRSSDQEFTQSVECDLDEVQAAKLERKYGGMADEFTGVVEVPWSECELPENIEEVKKATKRELDTMLEMRLTPVSGPEVQALSEKQIKGMHQFRYSYTRRRATPEELAQGAEVGIWKCRIVSKDLKVRHKRPVEATHSKVPSTSGFRLLVAATNLNDFEVWVTDFKCAYLQSFKSGEPRMIKVWNPIAKRWDFYWCSGVVYGDQSGAAEWKHTLAATLTGAAFLKCRGEQSGNGQSGFHEVQNEESMYYHQGWGVRISIHVDDPFCTIDKRLPDFEQNKKEFMAAMEASFILKGWKQLTTENEIDYLSIRVTADAQGRIRLDNDEFVKKLLKKYEMEDCNPVKRPINKDTIQLMHQDMESANLTDEAGKTAHLSAMGDFNWLAQTTHPGLAVPVSIYSSYNSQPPLASVKAVKLVLRWLKGTLGKGLVSNTEPEETDRWSCDSDWAGLHGINGEVRSRGGRVGCYRGMPFHWCSEWIQVRQSSAEAEAFEMSQCVKAARHFKYLMEELDLPHHQVTNIQVDATAAIAFANNTASAGRMKHIDVRSAWMQDLRYRGSINFVKVNGNDNPADFFTKILDAKTFDTQHGRFVRDFSG